MRSTTSRTNTHRQNHYCCFFKAQDKTLCGDWLTWRVYRGSRHQPGETDCVTIPLVPSIYRQRNISIPPQAVLRGAVAAGGTLPLGQSGGFAKRLHFGWLGVFLFAQIPILTACIVAQSATRAAIHIIIIRRHRIMIVPKTYPPPHWLSSVPGPPGWRHSNTEFPLFIFSNCLPNNFPQPNSIMTSRKWHNLFMPSPPPRFLYRPN